MGKENAKKYLESAKEGVKNIPEEHVNEFKNTLKELEDGTFEILKDNKIIAKTDAKGETLTYLYSTGEKLMTSSSVSGDTEIFFKNGDTFFKGDSESGKWFYKNGKIFYEFYKSKWRFFDTEGNQIISNFDEITDIKKID